MQRLMITGTMVLWAASAGLGDGCMFPRRGRSEQMVASPKQEALLASDGRTVEVLLRTHFRTNAEEIAWIVPVPGRPRDIQPVKDEIFEHLDAATVPQFQFPPSVWLPVFGCANASLNYQEAPSLWGRVQVEETGTAGIFEYTVLSATDARELTTWLEKHHYALPVAAERVLEHYVGKEWYWLAMRVRPEGRNLPTLAPHPIHYRYEDDKLVYPMIISQLSADLENEIVLHVVGPTRYMPANWTSTTIKALTDDGEALESAQGRSGTNYESLFRSATAEQQGQLFVTEYAETLSVQELGRILTWKACDEVRRGWDQQVVLTRLRALMTPGVMDRDVLLVPVIHKESISPIFQLSGAKASAGPRAAMAGLPLLVIGALLPARRRTHRIGQVACLLLIGLLLMML